MSSARVLLVDNNEDSLVTLTQELNKAGHTVITASSPQEATDIYNEKKTELDVGVFDIHLKDDEKPNDLSGLELAEQLNHQMPKIIITSHPTPEITREIMKLAKTDPAIVGYVEKNEEIGTLDSKIKEVLSTEYRKSFEG